MGMPFDKAEGYNPLDIFAVEALSVAGTAVGFTSGTYEPSTGQPAVVALVQCQVAAVRYRTDGTDPTAAIGKSLEIGDELAVCGKSNLDSIRFISRDGGTATLATEFARLV
jgi:hypothetical protein